MVIPADVLGHEISKKSVDMSKKIERKPMMVIFVSFHSHFRWPKTQLAGRRTPFVVLAVVVNLPASL